jgi:hypothetical protein
MVFVGQAGDLRRERASQAAGFVAVTIGAVALIGWRAGLPLLSSWGSGLPSVRPVGAVALAALGLALIYPGKDSRVAFAVGLAVTTLAALGVALALLNVELAASIDRWLAPRAAVPVPLGPALIRVAVAGALASGLAGGSLALSRFERYRLAATMLASIVGAIAVFALLGNLAGGHRHALQLGVSQLASAADRCWPALRRRGDPLADRNDARAPQVPAVVAPAGHARMRDRCAAPAVWRIRGI